jgi:hypothetical protein
VSRDGFTCPHCGVTGAANWKQIVDEYNAGVGMRTLAERHGIDIAAVCRGLHKRGVPVRPIGYRGPYSNPNLTRDWRAIAAEYEAGASLKSLASKHHTTFSTLWKWFKRLGIPRRAGGRYTRTAATRALAAAQNAARRQRRYGHLDWSAIAAEYEEGATLRVLGQRYCVPVSTVRKALRARRVTMRPSGRPGRADPPPPPHPREAADA